MNSHAVVNLNAVCAGSCLTCSLDLLCDLVTKKIKILDSHLGLTTLQRLLCCQAVPLLKPVRHVVTRVQSNWLMAQTESLRLKFACLLDCSWQPRRDSLERAPSRGSTWPFWLLQQSTQSYLCPTLPLQVITLLRSQCCCHTTLQYTGVYMCMSTVTAHARALLQVFLLHPVTCSFESICFRHSSFCVLVMWCV